MDKSAIKTSLFSKIKNSKINININKFIVSPWATAMLGALTLACHIFALELALYVFVGLYALYICILGKDLLPLMPLFVFCYIAPNIKNNPGVAGDSVFYGATGIIIICEIVYVICAMIIRVCLDKNIGIKKLFTQKRALTLGMLLLGLAYVLSGIGRPNYSSIFKNNLVASLLQFSSVFLLYFIFTAGVDWKNAKKDYFAWLGIMMGFVVSGELIYIYLTKNVIQNGSIVRSLLLTGWGHYNNMGALIAMSIPFAFYMCCKKKHNYIFLGVGTILLACLFLSCSRGSIVGGAFIYAVCVLIAFFKAANKKSFRFSCLGLIVICSVLGIIFKDLIITLFEKVPSIINTSNGLLEFNDSSRFNIYKEGFNIFLQFPVFGSSFYSYGYTPYDFSKIEAFSTFFPPRWHNTIIQILASCGVVGIVAYAIHRYQTIKLFIKKPTLEKTFIGLSVAALLLMSLLDCHFFNLGPTLIYSMMLAFAECINN